MKRWALRLVWIGALVFLLSLVLGNIDYWRVQRGQSPLFVINWSGFFDGGTYVGCGLGYTVAANHGCKYAQEHGKSVGELYWTEGPELKFWFFPFLNKADLKFRPLGNSV